MGERVVRNDEVRGSIPLGSTSFLDVLFWISGAGRVGTNPAKTTGFRMSWDIALAEAWA
jgi:hypothetical protein